MDDGGSAFPNAERDAIVDGNSVTLFAEEGMSLRDYFAATVLNGLLCDPEVIPRETEKNADFRARLARKSYEYADAMLEARLK